MKTKQQKGWEERFDKEWGNIFLGIDVEADKDNHKELKSFISTERNRVIDEVMGVVEEKRKGYKGVECDGKQRRNWMTQGYRQACFDLLSTLSKMKEE